MAAPVFDDVITFVYTRDIEASTEFYERKLELGKVYEHGGCKIYRASANGYLGVCYRQNAPEQPFDYENRNVIFTFVTDDVDGWFARLKERGVEPAYPPGASEEYGVYSGFIRDPNGYLLEIQRFLNPDWSPGA